MADQEDPKAEASAEKAYAAAAEAVPVHGEAEATPAAKPEADAPGPAEPEASKAPVEFPAKAERTTKPAGKPAAAIAPAAESEIKADLPKASKAKPGIVAKPVRKTTVKPVVAPEAKPVAAKAAPKPTVKSAMAKAPTKAGVVKTSPLKTSVTVKSPPAPQLKEKTMEKAAEFNEGLEKVATNAKAKAEKAYDKSSAVFGEVAEFAKGNVEALVESGKILATGLQKMGSDMVAESKTAIETVSGDVKQLTAVKSPSEFIKFNTDILRRNFDSAVALTSKNGEALMKLATDSFAPISSRISLAAEKLKKAA